jgi:dienelactone hydrolase
MRWLKWIGLAVVVILVLGMGGFLAWAYTPLGPTPAAVAALGSDANVQVEQGQWIVFRPTGQEPTTGLILYPGGRVDPRAYAQLARGIAERGYLVVIVPMPLNLAIFGAERAHQVMAAFPEIKHWVVGGHSLGGVMAAQFAYKHPNEVDGLVLWASYPMQGNSLADRAFPVVSIYGSEDMGRAQIEASRSTLPPSTGWVLIPGGNHGQFGDYGPQPGDHPATIDRSTQQAQVVDATAAFLQSVEASPG